MYDLGGVRGVLHGELPRTRALYYGLWIFLWIFTLHFFICDIMYKPINKLLLYTLLHSLLFYRHVVSICQNGFEGFCQTTVYWMKCSHIWLKVNINDEYQ